MPNFAVLLNFGTVPILKQGKFALQNIFDQPKFCKSLLRVFLAFRPRKCKWCWYLYSTLSRKM